MESSIVLSHQEIDRLYESSGIEALPSPAERRHSQRWPFPETQLLGPCGSWGLPKIYMFCEVRCHDLSQSGVSFFLPRPATFEQAVIGLGKQPNITYLLVRLTHCKEHAGEKKQYLVGCQFLNRVTI